MKSNEIDEDSIVFPQLRKRSITDEFFAALATKYKPQLKSFGNITYMSFLSQGCSFCFKDNALDSVFYYNENIDHYSKYAHSLPHGLSFDIKNTQVVQKLGDTPRKGGGKMSIFLCYLHLGIEITFLNSNWNDFDNPIKYISQFDSNTTTLYCSTCTKEINQANDYAHCDNKCNLVFYCNDKCKALHHPYHLVYCKPHHLKDA